MKQIEIAMRHAIALSNEKMMNGSGGPFGAVIVKDNAIIAEGWNQVTSCNDPTAHAEVVAIRDACQNLNTFELNDCEIYCSCEPCPMCLSAIYWARIDKIYFANTKNDAANIGFDDAFIYEEIEKPYSERSIPAETMMRNEAKEVFDLWLKKEDKIEY
jgi:tRNA(Arg) A34 adenosine deaminase TadA